MELKQIFLSLTLLASVSVASAQTVPDIPPQGTPIFEFAFSGGRHFNTLNYQEGINAGFSPQNIAWHSTESSGALTTLLYRCVVPNGGGQDHFASQDPNCEGQLNEGNFGYVFKAPRLGLVPLYRYYAHPNGFSQNDHWINKATQNLMPTEYGLEGIIGYVYP
ncbi:hypothetical protein H8L32_22885 [Undibacterium sp. CY18W]|uniref:DUF5648 domain-containing protein n=1 Tax=Undibacterium hunanense TaxID=2762292 RepID=A0ABR6ZWR8_9BURK|nr:hypothetical protein [Undibacterium hunanense]MBC3920328.1 hypothetical protein [Undibacterium hunanense]